MSLLSKIKANTPNTATVGMEGEYTLGVFYASLGRSYHVCRYIPFPNKPIPATARCQPPTTSLCGLHRDYWSACGPSERLRRAFCKVCDSYPVGPNLDDSSKKGAENG